MPKMLTVSRVDFVGKKIGSVKKTDEGYITGQVPVAKIGVLTYFLADGTTRKELVNEDVLFNSDSMASLKMKPITDQHPPEKILNSSTVKRRKVGFTGETVNRDGDFLTTSVMVTDSDAISSIDNGRRELSPGYVCELSMESGSFQGINYDAIQTRRIYNHLAICDKARGGEDLKMKLDSMDAIDGIEVNLDDYKFTSEKQSIIRKENEMPTIRIDGIDYNADQQVINHIGKTQSELANMQIKLDNLQKEVSEKETKLTDVTTKLDAEIKKGKETEDSLPKKISEAVKERVNLEKVANVVLDEKEIKEIDKLDSKELRAKIITSKNPEIKLDDKSEDYLQARFDTIVESLTSEQKNAIASQREKAFHKDSKSDNGDKVEKSRSDMISHYENAWKPKQAANAN